MTLSCRSIPLLRRRLGRRHRHVFFVTAHLASVLITQFLGSPSQQRARPPRPAPGVPRFSVAFLRRRVPLGEPPRMTDAADVCYFYPWPTMSTAPSEMPATVSLADEEAVRRILVDTLGDGQQPDSSASIAARALSREVRVCAHRAGALGLRGSQADVLGPEHYELRHHTGGGPGLCRPPTNGRRRRRQAKGSRVSASKCTCRSSRM